MKLAWLISAILICAIMALTQTAEAQDRSGSNMLAPRPGTSGPSSFAAPTGQSKFEACCESCPAGGCTGCNAYPNTPHLNCGSGLIKAKCQVVDNTSTCIRDDG